MPKALLLLAAGIIAVSVGWFFVSKQRLQPVSAQPQKLVVGMPNWPAGRGKAHIIKMAIESNFGIEVELQNGTNAVIFAGMDTGAMHVHPAVWLPNQNNLHEKYVTQAGTVRQASTPHYGKQQTCVTKATAERVGIRELHDLADPQIAAQFDRDGDGKGEMWIGASGWASTVIEKIRAKSYGYDQTMTLLEMDEALALARLDDAVKTNKNYVFCCDAPHYTFLLYDLVMLKEPPHDPSTWQIISPTDDPNWLEKSTASTAWERTRVHVYYSASLEITHPAVAKMLQQATFSSDIIGKMNYALVVDKISPVDYARTWIQEQRDAIDTWLR